MRCPSCQVVNINGVRCHEIGCPDAWREQLVECFECGAEYVPGSAAEARNRHRLCDDCQRDACEEEWAALLAGADEDDGSV